MVRYSDDIIEEVINSNDIVDIVSQYVTLKRSGRNFLGLCPFHKEKTPSFSVSTDKQIFHCFGCGVGGNVIHFVSKIESVNFRESIEILADKAGITLPTIDTGEDSKRQELKQKVYQINELVANLYHETLYGPNAKAPSIHMMKVDVETEVKPIIGSEQQSEDLVNYLMSEFRDDKQGIWNTNLFGKPLSSLVKEDLDTKIGNMPTECQKKLRRTVNRIINEGKGGVICILL